MISILFLAAALMYYGHWGAITIWMAWELFILILHILFKNHVVR